MPRKPVDVDREAVIREQAAELERLRDEIKGLKTGEERLYMLPHPTRKGTGDLWRGYEEGRERPDNVKIAPEAVGRVQTPTNEQVVEALAAQRITQSAASVAAEVVEGLEAAQE